MSDFKEMEIVFKANIMTREEDGIFNALIKAEFIDVLSRFEDKFLVGKVTLEINDK